MADGAAQQKRRVFELSEDELEAMIAAKLEPIVEALRAVTDGAGEVMLRHDAARFLACSLPQLDRLVRDHGLPFRWRGDTRVFLRGEIRRWLDEQTAARESR